MRIKIMITKEKNAFSSYQILLTNSLRKCLEISQENLYMNTGAQRVKTFRAVYNISQSAKYITQRDTIEDKEERRYI